jgi:hypothetical protein
MLRVVVAISIIAVFIYGLIDCAMTNRTDVRGISKTAWLVVMIVLPVLGALLWFIFGRPYGRPTPDRNYGHPTAPDDDPDFLRNLATRRRQQAEAERLRKLKEELDAREQRTRRSDGSGATDTDTSSPDH